MLTPQQRKDLRDQILNAFVDAKALEMFLDEHMNLKLDRYVASKNNFETQCFDLINRAQSDGKITDLLQSLANHHSNAGFSAFAAGLLATQTPLPVAAPPRTLARPYIVKRRPILNRRKFWDHLASFATESGNRVLVVKGGVGKSYSLWLASHHCASGKQCASIVQVSVNAGKVLDVDGTRIVSLIADRLWGHAVATDEFATPVRGSRDFGALLVQRLSQIQERTWIFLDEFNLVNIDDSALELLRKLCTAIDAGECPKVWLLLVGLDPAKLDARVGAYLPTDDVERPTQEDIKDYLVWFAQTLGRSVTAASLDQVTAELGALLPDWPGHADWATFHRKLAEKCQAIEQGVLK